MEVVDFFDFRQGKKRIGLARPGGAAIANRKVSDFRIGFEVVGFSGVKLSKVNRYVKLFDSGRWQGAEFLAMFACRES